MGTTPQPYPGVATIEGIPVEGFPDPASLFERIKLEARKAQQSAVFYLNVHVANTARDQPRLKAILAKGDVVYCDGAGIVVAARMTGQRLPRRLTAADWFLEMLGSFARDGTKVFLLGGEPGVPERALGVIEASVPDHTVVGVHHGFVARDARLERRVIARINEARPDVLIVGLGTPLQEYWIDAHRHELNVPVLYAIGATMDFLSGKVSRCPRWVGDMGFEWLYRLLTEPRRLFVRYTVGNTRFVGRTALAAIRQRIAATPLLNPARRPRGR